MSGMQGFAVHSLEKKKKKLIWVVIKVVSIFQEKMSKITD